MKHRQTKIKKKVTKKGNRTFAYNIEQVKKNARDLTKRLLKRAMRIIDKI